MYSAAAEKCGMSEWQLKQNHDLYRIIQYIHTYINISFVKNAEGENTFQLHFQMQGDIVYLQHKYKKEVKSTPLALCIPI